MNSSIQVLSLQPRNIKSGSSSVGRARPCQGRGRGFESRLPLRLNPGYRGFLLRKERFCRDGGIGRHARLKILCPLGRAGSSPAPGTLQQECEY